MAPAELLTTFSRLPDYLRQNGRAFSMAPAGDILQVRYQDGELAAVVTLERLRTAAGSEWIGLSIPLGPTSAFRLRAALVANDELPIGALSDWQGVMLLQQTLPVRSLSFEQLEQVLRALAQIGGAIVAGADYQYVVR